MKGTTPTKTNKQFFLSKPSMYSSYHQTTSSTSTSTSTSSSNPFPPTSSYDHNQPYIFTPYHPPYPYPYPYPYSCPYPCPYPYPSSFSSNLLSLSSKVSSPFYQTKVPNLTTVQEVNIITLPMTHNSHVIAQLKQMFPTEYLFNEAVNSFWKPTLAKGLLHNDKNIYSLGLMHLHDNHSQPNMILLEQYYQVEKHLLLKINVIRTLLNYPKKDSEPYKKKLEVLSKKEIEPSTKELESSTKEIESLTKELEPLEPFSKKEMEKEMEKPKKTRKPRQIKLKELSYNAPLPTFSSDIVHNLIPVLPDTISFGPLSIPSEPSLPSQETENLNVISKDYLYLLSLVSNSEYEKEMQKKEEETQQQQLEYELDDAIENSDEEEEEEEEEQEEDEEEDVDEGDDEDDEDYVEGRRRRRAKKRKSIKTKTNKQLKKEKKEKKIQELFEKQKNDSHFWREEIKRRRRREKMERKRRIEEKQQKQRQMIQEKQTKSSIIFRCFETFNEASSYVIDSLIKYAINLNLFKCDKDGFLQYKFRYMNYQKYTVEDIFDKYNTGHTFYLCNYRPFVVIPCYENIDDIETQRWVICYLQSKFPWLDDETNFGFQVASS